MVIPARAQIRDSASKRKPPMQYKAFPAPLVGWVSSQNYSVQEEGSASYVLNFFPQTTTYRMRGGQLKYATLDSAVTSMFSYSANGTNKMFAATSTKLYDVSSVASSTAVPSAAVSSRTSGYYSAAQISSSGGSYLVAVNGSDDALLYDGSTFQVLNGSSTPSITGVTTSTLKNVWLYAGRLFFIERNSLNAWFLPVDSIGGTAQKISLAGVFPMGGALMFGASWALDSGTGINAKCIFVTDQGEVAVYNGNDPSSASTWSFQGVYRIEKPLGMKAMFQIGGDLLIATMLGIVSMTAAVNRDMTALANTSFTKNIRPDWTKEITDRSGGTFELVKWPKKSMVIAPMPWTNPVLEDCALVCNSETNAWTKYSGHSANCITLYADDCYIGKSDGTIHKIETGGNDNSSPYTAKVALAFNHLGAPGTHKTMTMARVVAKGTPRFAPKLSASVDYNVAFPTDPSSPANFNTSLWDSAVWDASLWDGTSDETIVTRWASIGKTGFAFSPQIQVTSGISPTPNFEIISIETLYEGGSVTG